MKTALALILCLTLTCTLSARTLYLSPDGNDDSQPIDGAVFRTFNAVLPHLWGGDTLIVRKGEYEGGFHIRRGCPPDAPLIIRGEKGALVRGSGNSRDAINLHDCENVIIEGLAVTEAERAGIFLDHGKHIIVRNCRAFDNGKWGIFTSFASDFLLEGNECSGSGIEHGIYHSNSGDNFIIRGNIVHSNNGNGIHLNGDPEYGGDGVISRGIIEGNIIYGNGRAGGAAINMTHVQDVVVRNNVLFKNKSGAITFYQDHGTQAQGSKRALVIYNTIYFDENEGRAPAIVGMTSEGFAFFNNMVISGKTKTAYEINAINLPSVISDYNHFSRVDKEKAVFRFAGSWTDPLGLVNHQGLVQGYFERDAIANRREYLSTDRWQELTGNDRHSVFTPVAVRSLKDDDYRPGRNALTGAIDPASIRRELARLEDFEWVLEQLEQLPDVDAKGRARNADYSKRAVGAYEFD